MSETMVPRLHLGDAVESFVDWVTVAGASFFTAVKDGLLAVFDVLDTALSAPPAWTIILVVAALAWFAKGWLLAVGSAVGLRGFMSYIVGTTMGTALIGKLVDLYGWSAGFYTLLTGAVLAIVFGVLSHLGSLELEAKKQADLAKADTLDAGDVATAGARA